MIESQGRENISLDGVWRFVKDDENNGLEQRWHENDSAFTQQITVPGCWQAQEIYCQTGWYRRTVFVPQDWNGKRVCLKFAGVSYEADVWLNGQPVIHHEGLMLPFQQDVSANIRYGEENIVVVRVAQYDYGNVFQTEQLGDKIVGVYGCWVTWGGIFQSVTLEAAASAWVGHVALTPDIDRERVNAKIDLRNITENEQSLQVSVNVQPGAPKSSSSITIPAHGQLMLEIPVEIPNATLWHPDQPFLYTATVTLTDDQGVVDSVSDRFGMRKIEVRGKQILLNHEPIFLRGWLDDAIYPDQISPTITIEEARAILRSCKEYGFNFVRHHTHIPVVAFHEAADEIGVLQLQEFASFGSIGRPRIDLTQKTRQQIFETWRGMIERDFNHPSLIAYGVNNECWSDYEFLAWAPIYRDLYRLGKELDPTRLVIDNSGGEDHWSVASDVYDKHVYQFPTEQEMTRVMQGRTYRTYNPSREAYFNVDLSQVDKPCLVTEVGGWCTFPDYEKIRAHTGGKTPWWLSRDPIRNPRMSYALVNRMEREMPRELYPLIIENSENFAAVTNKIQLEHMRQTPGINGYAYCTFTDCYNWGAGILDNYFQPKSYAQMFANLNQASVLLWPRSRWCFRAGQSIEISLAVSHYGSQPFANGRLRWQLFENDRSLAEGVIENLAVGCFSVHDFAPFVLDLPEVSRSAKLTLRVELSDATQRLKNEWSLWVFPFALPDNAPSVAFDGADFERWHSRFPFLQPVGAQPQVLITSALKESHLEFLESGGRVLWLQQGDELSCRPYDQHPAVDYHATIVNAHPIMAVFANDGWCDMQFHHLLGNAILDTGYFENFTPIIEAFHVPYWMQNPRILPFRRKGFLAEAQIASGHLLTTSFVFDKLGEYAEVDTMALAMIDYLLSPTIPARQLTTDDLREWTWNSLHGPVETDYLPFVW